jgi:hypothetical protein
MLNQTNTIFKSLYTTTKIPKLDMDRIAFNARESHNFIGTGKLITIRVPRHVYMVKPGKEQRIS